MHRMSVILRGAMLSSVIGVLLYANPVTGQQQDPEPVPPTAAGNQPATVCSCQINEEKARAYNELLELDAYTRKAVIAAHLPWGVPKNPPTASNEQLLVQQHYVINHDGDLRVPTWAAYRLTADDLSADRGTVTCFRPDIRLPSEFAAQCVDYAEPSGVRPGYHRGHLVPGADMQRSEAAMVNTYILSNMTPQHESFRHFNEGLWVELEEKVRKWTLRKRVVYVIAGAIFDRTGPDGSSDGIRDRDNVARRVPKATGDGRVAIPSHFFKIILHPRRDGFIESLTFLLPHEAERVPRAQLDSRLKASLSSINEIEGMTGIEFLPQLTETEPAKASVVKGFRADMPWPVD